MSLGHELSYKLEQREQLDQTHLAIVHGMYALKRGQKKLHDSHISIKEFKLGNAMLLTDSDASSASISPSIISQLLTSICLSFKRHNAMDLVNAYFKLPHFSNFTNTRLLKSKIPWGFLLHKWVNIGRLIKCTSLNFCSRPSSADSPSKSNTCSTDSQPFTLIFVNFFNKWILSVGIAVTLCWKRTKITLTGEFLHALRVLIASIKLNVTEKALAIFLPVLKTRHSVETILRIRS